MAALRPCIPVSVGELIDKLSILDIKADRLQDPQALAQVRHERQLLEEVLSAFAPEVPWMPWHEQLMQVNQRLWDLEDAVRAHEREQRFDPAFVAKARAIYSGNDERARIKRAINEASGSEIVEVKSHRPG